MEGNNNAKRLKGKPFSACSPAYLVPKYLGSS